MESKNYRTAIGTDLAEALVSAARTSLGDTLRSVMYFTPSEFDVLYVRRDLYRTEDEVREAKSQLVEFEEVGFAEAPIRTAISRSGPGSSIGGYDFTVRFYDDGFVIRVITGDAGVLLTTDDMDVNAFDDAVSAITGLLGSE